MTQIKDLLEGTILYLYDYDLVGILNYMNIGFIVKDEETSVILETNININTIEFYNLTNSSKIGFNKDYKYGKEADIVKIPSDFGTDYILIPR